MIRRMAKDDMNYDYYHALKEKFLNATITESELKIRSLIEKFTRFNNEFDRQKNISAGKAVDVCYYNNGYVQMNADQLTEVFQRSGITLDKDSVYEKAHASDDYYSWFIIKDGQARMVPRDEDDIDAAMVDKWYSLTRLMAEQVKDKIYGIEDKNGKKYLLAMVHPDPKDQVTAEKFTIRYDTSDWKYETFEEDKVDNLMIYFMDDLYDAAADAYHKGIGKKTDMGTQQALDNIRIRKGLDDKSYISCNVYGEKQLSKRMSKVDAYYYDSRMNHKS